jgi:hypothetical protein
VSPRGFSGFDPSWGLGPWGLGSKGRVERGGAPWVEQSASAAPPSAAARGFAFVARPALRRHPSTTLLTNPFPPSPPHPSLHVRSASVQTALLSMPADYLAARICSSAPVQAERFQLIHKPM